MKRTKMLALLLCAGLILGCLCSCSQTAQPATTQPAGAATTTASTATADPATSSQATTGAEEPQQVDAFPISDELISLSYYIRINGAMSATMETYADVEFFKYLEDLTNIHIEWDHNTSNETFALMIASGELPDMINWNLGNATGGVTALLEDNIILDLTEMMPQYAPNYLAWMQANPEEDRAFKSDAGQYFQFVNFNCNWETMDMVYFNIHGPQIRKDWLDKVGMEMPTTTDELYDVLVAFRDADVNGNGDPSDEVPFAVGNSLDALLTLAGSFGARNDIMMDPVENKIVYGPITDNFKKFLVYANKLYSEGLINSDFAVNADAQGMITQNLAGFTISSMGSSLIANHAALLEQDPSYDYVSVPWLIGPDGYQCVCSDKNANPRATAITSACEYVPEAMRWLDYAYSEEGSYASTFGIEGSSYEWVDGYPTIMDAVKTNDQGWSEEQSMARWMLGPINYPNARDDRFYMQINLSEPYMVDIQTNWNLQTTEISLPPMTLTPEESSTYSKLMTDIDTYHDEMILKFIIGEANLDTDWDTYVATIQGMGLEEALACKTSALERYNRR